MSTFRDQLGRDWELRLDLAMLPRLRDAGFNVGEAVRDPKKLDALDDPEALGRVLWVLVEEQAARAGVDPSAFAKGFDGPTVFAAVDAFTAALVDFSQRPAVAAAIKNRLPAAWKKVEAALVTRVETEFLARIETTRSGSSGTGGSSPGAPGSIPEG